MDNIVKDYAHVEQDTQLAPRSSSQGSSSGSSSAREGFDWKRFGTAGSLLSTVPKMVYDASLSNITALQNPMNASLGSETEKENQKAIQAVKEYARIKREVTMQAMRMILGVV